MCFPSDTSALRGHTTKLQDIIHTNKGKSNSCSLGDYQTSFGCRSTQARIHGSEMSRRCESRSALHDESLVLLQNRFRMSAGGCSKAGTTLGRMNCGERDLTRLRQQETASCLFSLFGESDRFIQQSAHVVPKHVHCHQPAGVM